MKQLYKQCRSWLLAGAIFISRLGFLPSNFSPLGSFGFFGHPYLYFLSILAFDALSGGFYGNVLWTYLGFAAYPVLGKLAKNDPKKQALLLPLASFLFFLISNFGVWLSWYQQSWSGLLLCYSLALPFYAKTLLGDLVFGYGYLVLQQFLKNRRQAKIVLNNESLAVESR